MSSKRQRFVECHKCWGRYGRARKLEAATERGEEEVRAQTKANGWHQDIAKTVHQDASLPRCSCVAAPAMSPAKETKLNVHVQAALAAASHNLHCRQRVQCENNVRHQERGV